MAHGFFTDKTKKPTEVAIVKIAGKSSMNWMQLYNHLSNGLKLKGELKFYGVNYGWAIRFTRSGKSIIALYPNKDYFSVQVILNKNQADAALKANMSKEVIDIIKKTEEIHEGKWIFLKIDQNTDIKDIIQLIETRIKIK